MVVGFVSGAGANDGLAAIATGFALACAANTALAAVAEGFGMLPTVTGDAFRRSDVDAVLRALSVLRRFCRGDGRRGRVLLRDLVDADQVFDLGPVQGACPSERKACGQRHRREQERPGARDIWLAQHQHVIAIAAQDIGHPCRLSWVPTAFKENRLAVLHGVTHGLVSR